MLAGPGFEFIGTERFEIRRRLGAGGMGVVYEAFDRQHEVAVALKTLRDVDANKIYRLKTEFRALHGIEHPNIVHLGELLSEHGVWFFTMEFVDGVDFLAHVRGRAAPRVTTPTAFAPTIDSVENHELPRPRAAPVQASAVLDEERLRAALVQLASGLASLHEAGKVHRDIKPSNVLVTPTGRVVILDLGLAAPVHMERDATFIGGAGTVEYMAPEQAMNGAVGPAADWYSFGVVLYEALTGCLPHTGETTFAVLRQKQEQVPTPPHALCPGLSEQLSALAMELLAKDPSARPEAAAVLHRLGASAVAHKRLEERSEVPFVGRTRELTALHVAWREAERGAPVLVVVHGESGIGKSALVERFSSQLTSDGAAVSLHGRCYERESVPYKAFDGVADALSRYLLRLGDEEVRALLPRRARQLAQLFPVLQRVPAIATAPRNVGDVIDPREQRMRLFDAFRELLGRMAEKHPVVAYIDDFQWADADSLLLLRELLDPHEAPALLLIITVRTDAGGLGLGDIEAALAELDVDVRLLPIRELSASEARQMVRALGAGAVETIAESAGGHPLFLRELARHAAERGTTKGPLRLDDAICERVTRLSGSERSVLEILCVAAAPLERRVLTAATGVDATTLDKALGRLRVQCMAQAASTSASAFEPYHDRVRKAILRDLSSEQLRRHHAAVAAALEAEGAAKADPQMLVLHLEGAGDMAGASRLAAAAGEQAAEAMAFERAAEFYAIALRDEERAVDQRCALRIALGEALINAGRGADAADELLRAAADAEPAVSMECERLAAEQLLISGHIERGTEVLARLLAAQRLTMPKTPQRALAALLWHRGLLRLRGIRWRARSEAEIPASELMRLDTYRAAGVGLGTVDTIRGAYFQTRTVREALRVGEPVRLCHALAYEAGFVATQSPRGIARARAILAHARSMAEASKETSPLAWTMAMEGVVDYMSGQFVAGAEALQLAEQMFRERTTGSTWAINQTRMFRVWALIWAGDYAEMTAAHDAYLRDAIRRGDRYVETTLRCSCSIVWLVRGDLDRARANLERALWTPPADQYHLQHWFTLKARVENELYAAADEAMLATLAEEFTALERSLLTRVQIVRIEASWLRGRLALARLARGNASELPVAAKLARRLGREGLIYASVCAALLTAGVELAQQRRDAVASSLSSAIELAAECGMSAAETAARYWRGALIGGDEGTVERAEARRWAQRHGVAAPERFLEVLVPGWNFSLPKLLG